MKSRLAAKLGTGARLVNAARSNLIYHADAMRLASETARFSEDSETAIRERESALGITFPSAVREWYALDDAVGRLERYSNADQVVAIHKLGQPFDDWYDGGPRDFVAEGLLLFMQENQGVCNWAIKLNGEPDPAVVVEVDTAPDAVWLPCANRFSTFIWCQIWDRRPDYAAGAAAQEELFSPTDLAFVRSQFRELPATFGWPGQTNYRFENQHGGVLIWDGGEDRGVDWLIAAPTPADLKGLLRQLWHCGRLSQTLYANRADSEEVLAMLRTESPSRSR